MFSAALKVSQPLWKNLQRFPFLFWSYSHLILYFPFLPSFHMQWVFNSFPPLYHFNLGFQFPNQNNAMQFHVFFSGNLKHNLLLRRGEKESGGENNRWILLQYLLVFCFARCSLRYRVLVQIPHHPLYFYLIVDLHLAMTYLTMRQFQQWSIGQCPSAITWFLLFILNHKCRQLPAERTKFDITASVIFKEPESSFERSSFLHVSTFSQQIFGENNGFNEQCFNRAYSVIVSRQSTIL